MTRSDDDDPGVLLDASNFVEQTAGVTDAVAVSSDGLLMAMSITLDRAAAEPVAAIISGLVSLGQGAAGALRLRGPGADHRRPCAAASCSSPRSPTVRAIGVVARNRLRHRRRRLPDDAARRAGRPLLTPALVTELARRSCSHERRGGRNGTGCGRSS